CGKECKPVHARPHITMDCGGKQAVSPTVGMCKACRMPAATAVPNSAGTAPPRLQAPPNACDCHMHIYDAARFPPSHPQSRMTANAGVPQYRLFQQRIGTSRVVVVQPAANHIDNRVTLDALAQLGRGARGIAVVHPS